MHHIFILDRGGSSSLEKELTFFYAQFFKPHLILLPFDFFNSVLQESSLDKYSWMKILSFTRSDAIFGDETIVLWWFVLWCRCLLSKRLRSVVKHGMIKGGEQTENRMQSHNRYQPLRWNQWIQMCFVYPPPQREANNFSFSQSQLPSIRSVVQMNIICCVCSLICKYK